MEITTLDAITVDDKNYRIHNDKNRKVLNESIKNHGIGRSILIDKNNKIIGGNETYNQVSQLNKDTKVAIVETVGDVLVAVRRADLDSNDYNRHGLALADNTSSDLATADNQMRGIDWDLVKEDLKLEDAVNLGMPEVGSLNLDSSDDNNYEEIEKNDDGVNKELITCPVCGHVNEKKAFQKYDQNSN